jgi:methylated-DNA-[protein]-cysteine S-methyltransferase
MPDSAFALFDTTIGRCAIVWRGEAIVGSALPDISDDRMRAVILRRFPAAVESSPPPFAARAVHAVQRLLRGEVGSFSDTPLNLAEMSDFDREVLEECSQIPVGETRTYGEIAAALGAPGASRAVGKALGSNPIPIIIPCHRVLAANGGAGGFSAPGGAHTKLKILEIEGAQRGQEPQLFDRLPWRTGPA